MGEVVLVDFSGLSHTAWHPAVAAHEEGEKAWAAHWPTCPGCSTVEGKEVTCGYAPRRYDPKEVLKTNIDLKFQTLSEALTPPPKSWFMIKDGHETKRKALLPSYKGTRDNTQFDPRPLTEAHVRTKGCPFFWSPDAEADDLIATLTGDLVGAGINVVIVSSDKDLWQLFDPPRVQIYLTTKKEFLTREYMEKRLRVSEAKHVRLVKSLWGDISDNVPNAVPRMQAQLVPLIKSCDGTLQDFLLRAQRAPLSARCRQLLEERSSQILLNWEVVGLYMDVPVESL